MEAMPDHDPTPPASDRSAQAWARYRTMMKWMVLAAALAAIAALLYLRASGVEMPGHLIVATIAGVGTGLMGLVFVSNSSGHDDEAGGGRRP